MDRAYSSSITARFLKKVDASWERPRQSYRVRHQDNRPTHPTRCHALLYSLDKQGRTALKSKTRARVSNERETLSDRTHIQVTQTLEYALVKANGSIVELGKGIVGRRGQRFCVGVFTLGNTVQPCAIGRTFSSRRDRCSSGRDWGGQRHLASAVPLAGKNSVRRRRGQDAVGPLLVTMI